MHRLRERVHEIDRSARPLIGQHAAITGASGGIGAAIAAQLASLGADLALMGRTAGPLERERDRLAEQGREIHAIAVDVTDAESVRNAFATARTKLGSIEILVNCAGAAESAPFSRTDEQLWDRMLEVNVTGPYRCIREVLPGMLERGAGRIVNVASSAGLRGYPYVTAYTAAKHALVGLTRALALETGGTGITVNAVCPGYVDTPMTDRSVERVAEATGRAPDEVRARLAAQNPIGRLVRPEEVATAVVELCLPAAASRTGEAVPVGGPF